MEKPADKIVTIPTYNNFLLIVRVFAKIKGNEIPSIILSKTEMQ